MESPRDPGAVVRGFTLVELIVVLVIIIIITTITITSQTKYNRSLILTNTTYTVALSIREAQSLGLSSRNFGGIQNAGYGINFLNTQKTQYRIFADIEDTPSFSACPTGTVDTPEAKPGNCLYDTDTEILTTYNLNKGFQIHDFCGLQTSNNARVCGSVAPWTSMNITFLRPNTEAIMSMENSSGVPVSLKCAVIWIAPPSGAGDNLKCIVVSQVGQVSVPQACPAANFTTCP